MYLCFHWLQLPRRSMHVINTLQQLTFNILPQPLTPLIGDWLCRAWEHGGWEWHGSILSVKAKAGCSAAELLTPFITLSIRGYLNHSKVDLEIQKKSFHYSKSECSHRMFACILTSYLPLFQTPFTSTSATFYNLIRTDVSLEEEGSDFPFNQMQAFS